MGKITIENNIFTYSESGLKKVLLDCNDFMANKSRMPMHSFDGDLTVPALILNTLKEHAYLNQGKNDSLEYLLMDVILIACLIGSPLPVKVLEIGCVNGVMSYHLASILGRFHKDSLLCCVCDIIGNSSGNQWLDRISQVDIAPRLSLIAADYDDTQLAEDNFDVVLINGTIAFEDPYRIIKEAERVIKNDGMIICYSEEQPLLESCFKLIFSEREDYMFNPASCVMVVQVQKTTEMRGDKENTCWYNEVRDRMDKISDMIKCGVERKDMKRYDIQEIVQQLDRYIDQTMANNDLDMKIELIHQKEMLLDLMLRMGGKG